MSEEAETKSSFLERNIRLYGEKYGKKYTDKLASIGVHDLPTFINTNFDDVAVLAQDIDKNRAIKLNSKGNVIDSKARSITHSGNGVYHVLGELTFENDEETNKYIGHYVLDAKGDEQPTDFFGHNQQTTQDTHGKDNAHAAATKISSYTLLDNINMIDSEVCANNLDTNLDKVSAIQFKKCRFAEETKFDEPQEAQEAQACVESNHPDNTLAYIPDVRLLTRLHLVKIDYIRRGIHLYYFRWNKTAERLYNCKGNRYGVLNCELRQFYPGLFQEYNLILITANEAETNPELQRLRFILRNCSWFNRYMKKIFQHTILGPNLINLTC